MFGLGRQDASHGGDRSDIQAEFLYGMALMVAFFFTAIISFWLINLYFRDLVNPEEDLEAAQHWDENRADDESTWLLKDKRHLGGSPPLLLCVCTGVFVHVCL